MEEIISLTKLAYHFGPFAFSIIFIFFTLRFVANRLASSSGQNATLYRGLSVVAWGSTLALVFASIVAWFILNVNPPERTVTGVVMGLRSPEYVYSPTMYVRKVNENEVVGTYDYAWIARARDLELGDELQLTVSYSASDHHTKRLPVSDELFGRHIRHRWDRRNARLLSTAEPNTIADLNQAGNRDALWSLFVPSAHAASEAFQKADPMADLPCQIEQLTSDRCLGFVASELTNSATATFTRYHTKRTLLKMLNSLDPPTRDALFAATDERSTPNPRVPAKGKTLRDVFNLAIATEDDVKREAIRLAVATDPDEFRRYLMRQVAHKDRARRLAAVETIGVWGDVEPIRESLEKYRETEPDPVVSSAIENVIALADSNVYQHRLQDIPQDQVREVIKRVLQLRGKPIRYVQGGRDPTTGFDSVNFMAWLLTETGTHDFQTGESTLPTDMYEAFRPVEQSHKQAGDLIFFDYGVVMMYLWDDQVVGMMRNGIVIEALSPLGVNWGIARFADDFDIEVVSTPTGLSADDADRLVKAYYAEKGEWAGVFAISEIIERKLESKGDSGLLARVQYAYEPTPDSYRPNSGIDYRIFDFERMDGQWLVTGMRGHLSGIPILGLSQEESQRKVIEFYRYQSEWAGVYEIQEIKKLTLESLDETTKLGRVRYLYRPENYYQTVLEAGEDYRKFYFEFAGGDWQVVYMAGHMSGNEP